MQVSIAFVREETWRDLKGSGLHPSCLPNRLPRCLSAGASRPPWARGTDGSGWSPRKTGKFQAHVLALAGLEHPLRCRLRGRWWRPHSVPDARGCQDHPGRPLSPLPPSRLRVKTQRQLGQISTWSPSSQAHALPAPQLTS